MLLRLSPPPLVFVAYGVQASPGSLLLWCISADVEQWSNYSILQQSKSIEVFVPPVHKSERRDIVSLRCESGAMKTDDKSCC